MQCEIKFTATESVRISYIFWLIKIHVGKERNGIEEVLHDKYLSNSGGFPKMWWLYKVNNSATVDVILVIHTVQIWEGMRLPESRSFCSKLENVLLSGPSSISVCYISLMIHDSEECIRRYSHNIDIQWSGEHFYGILLHPSWL